MCIGMSIYANVGTSGTPAIGSDEDRNWDGLRDTPTYHNGQYNGYFMAKYNGESLRQDAHRMYSSSGCSNCNDWDAYMLCGSDSRWHCDCPGTESRNANDVDSLDASCHYKSC